MKWNRVFILSVAFIYTLVFTRFVVFGFVHPPFGPVAAADFMAKVRREATIVFSTECALFVAALVWILSRRTK
jgi:hypothetical protein